MELPKYKDSSKKGEDGITILKKITEKELQWIFRPNHKEHDFGIDAYLDIINEFGQLTGKTIACQVKTGNSYFKESNDHGWIYRGEMGHLNYYLNHDIPVVIILVNEIEQKAFWCHCDARLTERAGENWKISVPFDKQLTVSSKVELLKYISPVLDYASQLDHFWKINKELTKSDRLVFIVDKSEILNGSFKELKYGIARILVNPELIKHVKEKVDIWIHGYDDDPRELRDIPEVVNWIITMFKQVKGLTYLLTKDEAAQFFRVLQLCKMKFKKIEGSDFFEDGIRKHNVEVDFSSAKDFFEELFMDLNEFTDTYNISIEVNKEISGTIVEYLTNGDRPPGL